jgi:HK97 gp10 family phage protein
MAPIVQITVLWDKIPFLQSVVRPRARAAAQQAANNVRDLAQDYAPKRTGFMAEHIEVRPEEADEDTTLWEVGPFDVPYAGFVEHGTSKMAAQPFMAPAAANAAKPFIGVMTHIVDL